MLIYYWGVCWESGQHENAVALWSGLYANLDPQTEQAKWLANLIEESHAASKENSMLEPLFEVQVALAPEFTVNSPDAQLVVFVKSDRTGNMPILAQQIKQPRFPLEVTLTEQDAVSKIYRTGMRLSSLKFQHVW